MRVFGARIDRTPPFIFCVLVAFSCGKTASEPPARKPDGQPAPASEPLPSETRAQLELEWDSDSLKSFERACLISVKEDLEVSRLWHIESEKYEGLKIPKATLGLLSTNGRSLVGAEGQILETRRVSFLTNSGSLEVAIPIESLTDLSSCFGISNLLDEQAYLTSPLNIVEENSLVYAGATVRTVCQIPRGPIEITEAFPPEGLVRKVVVEPNLKKQWYLLNRTETLNAHCPLETEGDLAALSSYLTQNGRYVRTIPHIRFAVLSEQTVQNRKDLKSLLGKFTVESDFPSPMQGRIAQMKLRRSGGGEPVSFEISAKWQGADPAGRFFSDPGLQTEEKTVNFADGRTEMDLYLDLAFVDSTEEQDADLVIVAKRGDEEGVIPRESNTFGRRDVYESGLFTTNPLMVQLRIAEGASGGPFAEDSCVNLELSLVGLSVQTFQGSKDISAPASVDHSFQLTSDPDGARFFESGQCASGSTNLSEVKILKGQERATFQVRLPLQPGEITLKANLKGARSEVSAARDIRFGQ